ncbi:hypothetical protein ARMGADRAFT_543099 [Armillaria gallica]|uniref:Uncharacterized protein n=1 Tax=Armillaria gallica TaxID=47427 RepID=A0A2H3DAT1_ARMGA|nr:hypothetical protein ARMGADRAFT_543099 [Armillaria gallica]
MSSHLPSLGKTLGAVYIGAMLSSILLGITALQAVIYYKKFPHDPWYYRYSVAALWILDMLHVALNTHAIYFYLIDSFGNYLALDRVIWSFKLQVLINVIIVVGVQSLYAVRLWKLGHHFHRVIPWFIVVVIVGGCATGIAMTYDAYKLPHVSSLPSISKTVDGTFATSTSVDFIISGAMFYYLHKSTTITKFESYQCLFALGPDDVRHIAKYSSILRDRIHSTETLHKFAVGNAQREGQARQRVRQWCCSPGPPACL